MYYFNIQDILKEYQNLSSSEIKLKHQELYGYCNRTTLTKVLHKLVDQEIVVVKQSKTLSGKGRNFIYSLN